jgi:hypothetical protein
MTPYIDGGEGMITDIRIVRQLRRIRERRPIIDELKRATDVLASVIFHMYQRVDQREAEVETIREELLERLEVLERERKEG